MVTQQGRCRKHHITNHAAAHTIKLHCLPQWLSTRWIGCLFLCWAPWQQLALHIFTLLDFLPFSSLLPPALFLSPSDQAYCTPSNLFSVFKNWKQTCINLNLHVKFFINLTLTIALFSPILSISLAEQEFNDKNIPLPKYPNFFSGEYGYSPPKGSQQFIALSRPKSFSSQQFVIVSVKCHKIYCRNNIKDLDSSARSEFMMSTTCTEWNSTSWAAELELWWLCITGVQSWQSIKPYLVYHHHCPHSGVRESCSQK